MVYVSKPCRTAIERIDELSPLRGRTTEAPLGTSCIRAGRLLVAMQAEPGLQFKVTAPANAAASSQFQDCQP